jgi:LacI family transcriptional regulator
MTLNGSIGLLIGDLGNPFFAQLATAVSRGLDDADWGCLVMDCADRADVQARMADRLLDAGVRGVIATVPHSPDLLARADLAVVTVDRTETSVPFVATDGVHGGQVVATHLIQAGYTRCALLYAEAQAESVKDRITGFRLGLQGNGVEVDPGMEVDCGALDYEAARRAARDLIAAGAGAIFAINDLLAIGVLAAVADAGQVPGLDIGVVGFDDTSLAALPAMNLTSVAQGTDELGRRAAGMMLTKIARPEQDVASVVLRPHLVARGSTRRYQTPLPTAV